MIGDRPTWWLNFSGWILFTISAACFTYIAIDSESVVAIVASVTFLAACVLFIIPVIVNRPGH